MRPARLAVPFSASSFPAMTTVPPCSTSVLWRSTRRRVLDGLAIGSIGARVLDAIPDAARSMAGCAGGSYAIMWTDNLLVSLPTGLAVGLTAGPARAGWARAKPGVAVASAAGSPQPDRARGGPQLGPPLAAIRR